MMMMMMLMMQTRMMTIQLLRSVVGPPAGMGRARPWHEMLHDWNGRCPMSKTLPSAEVCEKIFCANPQYCSQTSADGRAFNNRHRSQEVANAGWKCCVTLHFVKV